ncbi:laminin subunit beta-1-like [Saccoglossus kowalevskii]
MLPSHTTCNCFDHSDSCYYDINVATLQQSLNADGIYSGGGVCIDCANNTSGNNCEKCHELYFRPLDKQQTDIDACQPCDCFLPGTKEDLDIGLARGHCVMNNETLRPPGMEPGDCFCKDNVEGVKCDVCRDGFYDLSASNLGGCLDCTCNIAGTLGNTTVCDKDTGLCPCKTYATERRCDECMDEYYGLSLFNDDACDPCGCNVGGSMDNVCNKLNGQCFCWNNILGQICDSVASEAYYPDVHFINAELESITATNWGRDEEYDGYFWYGYVSLSSGESSTTSLSIPSDTTFSGQYELLFHYIADNPTMVTVTLTSNGGLSNPISLSGSTTLSQCPDTWCYQSLNNADGISGNTFALTAGVWSVNVVSGISSGQVLLDRIIALPVEFLSPEVLLGADTATQFDVDCDVRNNIMNSTGNIEFCLEQVFILTTNYLQGALPCDCDLVGSYNNLCDEYGGQCACKTGVGGRRCDMCLPEYYAYSSTGCQPCNCFNDDKVCNMLTGQCDCPPNTVGRNCDRCVTYTYGLNSTHGCTPCNCDVEGSSNLQCDAVTGECACQPGVDGTTSSAEGAGKCTECKDGFKSFTLIGCEPCDCSLDGSVNIACNKTSGQCPCKVNTEGMLCDNCKAGTFYNSESHPTGCLQCVCMGITEDCRSSTLKNIQECASGYFRQNQTIHDYFGVCVLCDCNGHSDVCDKNTGECLNCQHNTAGFNCELCADGFYGDASQGEADDCESCPCSAPKTVTALCEFIDSIVTCINCSDGHTGPLCNQ